MKIDLSDIQIKSARIALHHQWHRVADDDGKAITCSQEIADATYETLKIFEQLEKQSESKRDDVVFGNTTQKSQYIDKDILIDDFIPILNRLSPKDKGDIMEVIYKQKVYSLDNELDQEAEEVDLVQQSYEEKRQEYASYEMGMVYWDSEEKEREYVNETEKRVYLVDVGILLSKDDADFDAYSVVYNKHYGYFDENQYYVGTLEEAVKAVESYVKNGVERTYGIVSNTTLDSDLGVNSLSEIDVEGEEYILDNVVYSAAKINGEFIENFLEKDDLLEEQTHEEER